jgi:hypothetical protein
MFDVTTRDERRDVANDIPTVPAVGARTIRADREIFDIDAQNSTP